MTNNEAGLKREIGLFGATALGIGAIVGSGIFIVTALSPVSPGLR